MLGVGRGKGKVAVVVAVAVMAATALTVTLLSDRYTGGPTAEWSAAPTSAWSAAPTSAWSAAKTAWVAAAAPLKRVFSSKDICNDAYTDSPLFSWQRGVNKGKEEEWWQTLCRMERDMRHIQYNCKDNRKMGNRDVCFDFGMIPPNNCTVYSFGIAYDFTFDDAMGKYGCTVFSFDPSMTTKDHRRSDKVTFKQIGISSKDTDDFRPRLDGYVKSATKWRTRRLSSIMKELGHSPGTLTVLKMDVESTEWEVMKDILSEESLLESIPQVLIEWHLFKDAPPRSQYAELRDIYLGFKDRGFQLFHWNDEGRDHKSLEALRSQTETAWVNERFMVPRGS